MNALIEVFRMTEIRPETRARIIIQLGVAINDQYASNITEPLVYELVKQLDPQNPILTQDHYIRHLKP